MGSPKIVSSGMVEMVDKPSESLSQLTINKAATAKITEFLKIFFIVVLI
jgi:hypothetical protein